MSIQELVDATTKDVNIIRLFGEKSSIANGKWPSLLAISQQFDSLYQKKPRSLI
jgi:hypothetical protein